MKNQAYSKPSKVQKVGNKFQIIPATLSTTDAAAVAKVKDADTASVIADLLKRVAALEGK